MLKNLNLNMITVKVIKYLKDFLSINCIIQLFAIHKINRTMIDNYEKKIYNK